MRVAPFGRQRTTAGAHQSKPYSIFIVALIFLIPLLEPPAAGAISISQTRPHIPSAISISATPRLIGSYVQEQDVSTLCSQEQTYGARFTWIAIPWYAIEPNQGRFVWTAVDPIVQAARACGMEIGAHVLSRSTWATLPPSAPAPSGALISMPPKNWNDYYNFVYQLASHYKGSISRYSIENEAHSSTNWPSSPNSYFQMLASGFRAVHDADPSALVEDAGLSSSTLGALVANDLLQSGNAQGAVQFWQGYFADYHGPFGGTVNNVSDLQALLSQPELQRSIQWASLLYANSQYFDVQQIHYFAPWDKLSQITDWVHNQLRSHGGDKPLDFWELGYGWDNMSTYDPQAHARDEVKIFATALGEGGISAIQFEFTDYAVSIGHPGLITSAGPQPPAQSFQLVAQKLNGAVNPQRLNLGSSAYGYRFDTAHGTVYVVWADVTTSISLPLSTRNARVTDITETQTLADPKRIAVTTSPIVVEPWTGSNLLYLPIVQAR